MLSFKRLLSLVLSVAIISCLFMFYQVYGDYMVSPQEQNKTPLTIEFMEEVEIDEEKKLNVRIVGPSDSLQTFQSTEGHSSDLKGQSSETEQDKELAKQEKYKRIHDNIVQYCKDLHLNVSEISSQDIQDTDENSLLLYSKPLSNDPFEISLLKNFLDKGGRIVFAAGIENELKASSGLLSLIGAKKAVAGAQCQELSFLQPLLPLQPEKLSYDFINEITDLEIGPDAVVYISETKSNVPILYTCGQSEQDRSEQDRKNICVLNGTFLEDVQAIGLLSGAISVLLPDFIYPVLGIKTVFIDQFPLITDQTDRLCRELYGYSAQGFIQDVLWPVFQGISLRQNLPFTVSVPVTTRQEDEFWAKTETDLLSDIGKSILQFDGELAYFVEETKDADLAEREQFSDLLSSTFPMYTVQSLVVKESENLTQQNVLQFADQIQTVRGRLDHPSLRFFFEPDRGYAVLPPATDGFIMEGQNLFALYSILGAYGMISHVFDAEEITSMNGNEGAWDLYKNQIGIFESDVLSQSLWLEGKTLAQTKDEVRSYQNMEYGWTAKGNKVELEVSNAQKNQAFFYHTDRKIVAADGASYQEIGNQYYLLKAFQNQIVLTLEN